MELLHLPPFPQLIAAPPPPTSPTSGEGGGKGSEEREKKRRYMYGEKGEESSQNSIRKSIPFFRYRSTSDYLRKGVEGDFYSLISYSIFYS